MKDIDRDLVCERCGVRSRPGFRTSAAPCPQAPSDVGHRWIEVAEVDDVEALVDGGGET